MAVFVSAPPFLLMFSGRGGASLQVAGVIQFHSLGNLVGLSETRVAGKTFSVDGAALLLCVSCICVSSVQLVAAGW